MSHHVLAQLGILIIWKKSCDVLSKPPPVKMIDHNKISWRISKRCCAVQEIWIYHFVTLYLCQNLCNVSHRFTLKMLWFSKKVESILIRRGWFKALRKIWRKVSVLDYRKKCWIRSKILDSLMAWLAWVQLNSVFLFSPSQAMSESRVFERIQHFLR